MIIFSPGISTCWKEVDTGCYFLPFHRRLAATAAGQEHRHAAAGEVHHWLLWRDVHPRGPRLLIGDSRDQVQGGTGLSDAGHGVSGNALCQL